MNVVKVVKDVTQKFAKKTNPKIPKKVTENWPKRHPVALNISFKVLVSEGNLNRFSLKRSHYAGCEGVQSPTRLSSIKNISISISFSVIYIY